MLRYTWRTLFTGRSRVVLSIGGVALSLVLVIALDAVFLGAEQQSTRYIDRSGADIVVSQAGVRTMHMAASTLPANVATMAREVPAVASVTPVLFASDIVRFGETRASAYIIGLPPDASAGLPPSIVAGKRMPDDGGAVVDERVADGAGLVLGDTITILGQPFRIDGLSRGTAGLVGSVVIIPLADFETIRGRTDTISFLFVTIADGASAPAVAEHMQSSIDGVTVQTREQFADEERTLIRDMGSNVLAVMNLLGFLIGLAVLALTVYLATLSRRSEFGMLKAVGAPNEQLYRMVLLQALASVGIGLLLAVALTLTLGFVLPRSGTTVSLALGAATLVKAAAASIIMATLAAMLPIRRIAGLDPALVFRGR